MTARQAPQTAGTHGLPTAVARDGRGFTLVELIVVVAILTLLVTMIVPTMTQYVSKARIINCRSRLKSVGDALTNYLVTSSSLYFPGSSHPSTSAPR